MDTKNEIIKEQKKELRTKVKKKISKLSRRETEESDKKILHQIKSLAEYKNADTIFCYVSTEKEINTIPLLQEILDSGKRLGVPKCTGKGIMDAYEIQNLEQLKIGSYGILEPGEECDIILDPTEIQFAIIPCISCNRKGERLGHGGGYYDRYLEKMPEDCEKAILCRESLMCDEIPTEGESYKYPDTFDIIVLRDGVAVSIRDKKIKDIVEVSQYKYENTPVVNGRGFEIKVNSQEDVENFLKEYKDSEGSSQFFSKWMNFDTYRKVALKASK